MSRDGGRRKLRIRRKRRTGETALPAIDIAGSEAVVDLGCCLVEAVLSASIIVGLAVVPAYLLIG